MKEVFSISPPKLPKEWKRMNNALFGFLGAKEDEYLAYMKKCGLTVTMTLQKEQDGKRWYHLSVSRPKKEPSYYDLCEVKNLFLGEDSLALLLFVPEAEHVNIHPHCLHLWSCVDGRPTPDFTWGMQSI